MCKGGKNGSEEIFSEIIMDNFPKVTKGIKPQIQVAQQTLRR